MKKTKRTLYCEDFHGAGVKWDCCGSCHEDDNEGLSSLGWTTAPGRSVFDPATDAELCCSAPNDPTVQQFAAALLYRRAKMKEWRQTPGQD